MIGRRLTELGPRHDEVGQWRRMGYDNRTDMSMAYDERRKLALVIRDNIVIDMHAGLTPEEATAKFTEHVLAMQAPFHYNDIQNEQWMEILSDATWRARWRDMRNALTALFGVSQRDYTETRSDIRPALLRDMLIATAEVVRDIHEDERDATRMVRPYPER